MVLLLVALVFMALGLSALRMMRQTDRMLDDVDKSKLKQWDDDD